MGTVHLQDGTEVAVGTIWCIGRNYARHVQELRNEMPSEPVVFLKGHGALRGLAPSPVAFPDETFHHELELVLLLGSAVPLGGRADWTAVRGVTLGLDLTRRGVQDLLKRKGLPWTTAKHFGGSAVVAPFVPPSTLGAVERITLSLEVEGELRQRGELSHLLFPVPVLLEHLARLAPLEPGDLVFTGTPEGVGPLRVGDRFRMTLAGPGGRFVFDGEL